MKTLETLVDDIYQLFDDEQRVFSEENIEEFGKELALKISSRLNEERKQNTLRLSNLGTPDRKLWYTINTPELGEPLDGQTKFKFLIGDILESLILFLAKEAGHSVEGEQDEISIEDVVGHRDAIVDNITCDVKSASSFSFDKFSHGLKASDDAFGYLTQLGSYVSGEPINEEAPRTESKDGAFIVVDKTLGKLTVDVHKNIYKKEELERLAQHKKEMLSKNTVPPRCYAPVPDGKSGNMKLDIPCSYCAFKKPCWPGLRGFLYSTGPRYLVKVERTPDVPEIEV